MQQKASEVMMYGGGLTAFLSGLSLSDVGVIVGIVLGVAGFVYNIWHTTQLRKIARNKGVNITED